MHFSPAIHSRNFARDQLYEVLMNTPFPLLVLQGPNHILTLANHAEVAAEKKRVQLGIPFTEAFPEFSKHGLPILDQVYRDAVTIHETETLTDGRYYNSTYHPLRDENGLTEGVIVSMVDVTPAVTARTTTENQKAWPEFILDLIPIPTIIVRPGSGEIILRNAAEKKASALLPREYAPAIADGNYFTDLGGNRIGLNDWPRYRAARGEELYGLQLIWHTPEGATPLVIESRRLKNAFGLPEVFAIHYHDVSDLKEAERALRESIGDLQRERGLREQFVATLTHDLKNPLTAAKLTAEMIARENPENVKLTKLSNRVCGNIARADRMIHDLLDANRMKAGGRLPLRIGTHCVNTIAQNCINGLSILHGDRFRLFTESKITARCCKSSLRRIFENLLGNAAKYAEPKTPIDVTLTPATGEDLYIRVFNLGNPIPLEDQGTLFQPYHRTRSATAGQIQGWGLGLALVRGLAEAHGGSVGLDFSDDRGTQFYVRLPIVKTNE